MRQPEMTAMAAYTSKSLRDIYAAIGESTRREGLRHPPRLFVITTCRDSRQMGRSCSRDPYRAAPEDPAITNKSDLLP